jgi:hypothetical protein
MLALHVLPVPQNNDFIGVLPEMSDLAQLHILLMSNNSMNGTIPSAINEARMLTVVDLSHNE